MRRSPALQPTLGSLPSILGYEMIKRITVVSASVALGCLATVVPVLTSLYVAKKDVERRERAEIKDFANKANMRAEVVTSQAFGALNGLGQQPAATCSPTYLEH